MDETGVTPDHIVAGKDRKQIGASTSREKGELVAVVITVSATGNSVPSMFIFPGKVSRRISSEMDLLDVLEPHTDQLDASNRLCKLH